MKTIMDTLRKSTLVGLLPAPMPVSFRRYCPSLHQDQDVGFSVITWREIYNQLEVGSPRVMDYTSYKPLLFNVE